MLIPRTNSKFFSATDLFTVHHEVFPNPETQKVVHFAVGDEQNEYKLPFED